MVGVLGRLPTAFTLNRTELAKAKGAPRVSYTERIMDVVRNLRKQKVAIGAILFDIRVSQKEVNALSETLQRALLALRRNVVGTHVVAGSDGTDKVR